MEGKSSLEKLKSEHSKEKKEMQAKIAGLKHAVTKNDKKKKKEVTLLIEVMEKELKDRHENQLKNMQQNEASHAPILDVAKKDEEKFVELSLYPLDITGDVNEKKPSKAQIRREKKVETAKRRAAAAEMDDKNAENSRSKIEMDEIKQILAACNLQLFDIAPDGDCLYNAISHQADDKHIGCFAGKSLRKLAGKYIREHSDDFLPFLTNNDGEMMDQTEFAEYCDNVEKTAREGGAWGGEPELRAISAVLKWPIEVIQPNGQIIRFGEEFTGNSHPLKITYHRFAYSLGEHYNSTLLMPAV